MPIHNRHRITDRVHIPHEETKGLAHGVKLLAWARTVRWVGWGFGESLLPLFIFAFSASYAEAGLLTSIYSIALLVALPIVGMLADRMSAKVLIIAGLALYPLVGASYFLAGAAGVALFVVLARLINGVSWALESVGIDTYYRRVTNRNLLASSFGYIETVAYAGWILAALVSMLLVTIVPVHYLLLLILPFSLLAIPIALMAPKDTPRPVVNPLKTFESYKSAISEWGTWDLRLKLLGVLVLFMGVIDTLTGLFIPIDAYIEGANFQMVVVLAIVATIPRLFGFMLGKLADHNNNYKLVMWGLLGVAVLMSALAFFPGYAVLLIVSFLLCVLMELFTVIGKALVTTLGPEDHYGVRGSTFQSIATIGNLAAPLLIGISLDVLGFGALACVLAGVAVAIAVAFALISRSN